MSVSYSAPATNTNSTEVSRLAEGFTLSALRNPSEIPSPQQVGSDLIRATIEGINYRNLRNEVRAALSSLGTPTTIQLSQGGELLYYGEQIDQLTRYITDDTNLAENLSRILRGQSDRSIIVIPFDSTDIPDSASAYNLGVPNDQLTAINSVIIFLDPNRPDLMPYVIGNELDEAAIQLLTGRPPTNVASEEATTRAENRLIADKLADPSRFQELSQTQIAQQLSLHYLEGLIMYLNKGLELAAVESEETVQYYQAVSNYLSNRMLENGLLDQNSTTGVATIGATQFSDDFVRLSPLLYFKGEDRVLLPEELSVPAIPRNISF